MRYSLPLLALLAAPAAAQERVTPYTVEETGRTFANLQDAVRAIGGGTGTIVFATGTHRQCAVQEAGRITYRAAEPGKALLDRVTCEGKAALVLRGRAAAVDGLVFQNLRVADRNGAGIRLERGDLTVTNAIFRGSEQGILTANDPRGTISVDRSTFIRLGGCPDGMCSHALYIGDYGRLSVTNSRFEQGTGGHYVKARAARVSITGNSFDDTRGYQTNYMIDLPAGAVGEIARNVFAQGANKENHSALIAVAAEQRLHTSRGLSIADNEARLAPGAPSPTVFVADWSHEPLALGANRLGPGIRRFETRQN